MILYHCFCVMWEETLCLSFDALNGRRGHLPKFHQPPVFLSLQPKLDYLGFNFHHLFFFNNNLYTLGNSSTCDLGLEDEEVPQPMGYKMRSGETPAHPCWQRNFDRGVSFGKNCSLAGVAVEVESFADTLIAAGWVEKFTSRANSLSTLSSISSPCMSRWTPVVERKLSVSLLKSYGCLY